MRRIIGVIAIAAALIASGCAKDKPSIIVGSANFPESQILGEIYAQALQAKGFDVSVKGNIGAREVYFPALVKGSITVFPEYTGSTLAYLSKNPSASVPDAQKNYDNMTTELSKHDLVAFDMASAQDTDGIVVNKQTADQYHLSKLSQLAAVSSNLIMGGPPECPKRQACLKGLQDVYGVHFKEFKALDVAGPITVRDLKSNAVQVANLFTTQSAIAVNGFVLLAQDKAAIAGAENVVPIVSKKVADAYGADFKAAADAVSAKLTTAGLLALNKRVEVDKEDAKTVAADWLKQNGLD